MCCAAEGTTYLAFTQLSTQLAADTLYTREGLLIVSTSTEYSTGTVPVQQCFWYIPVKRHCQLKTHLYTGNTNTGIRSSLPSLWRIRRTGIPAQPFVSLSVPITITTGMPPPACPAAPAPSAVPPPAEAPSCRAVQASMRRRGHTRSPSRAETAKGTRRGWAG